MASGFENLNGTDLDDLLEPRQAGDPYKAITTRYKTADGLDLNERYAPAAMCNRDATTANLGYIIEGTIDRSFQSVFGRKGYRTTLTLPADSEDYYVHGEGEYGASQITMTFKTNGQLVISYTGSSTSSSTSTWVTNMSSSSLSDYEIMWEYVGGGASGGIFGTDAMSGGTWYSLNTEREFTLINDSNGIAYVEFRVHVRKDNYESITDSTTMLWTVSYTDPFDIVTMNGSVASAYANGVPSSGVYLKSDGSTEGSIGAGSQSIFVQNWGTKVTAGVGADWQVKMTKTGTTVLGPDANTWHSLASDLFWYIIDSTNDGSPAAAFLNFTFRKASDTSTEYDGGVIQLNANRGSSLIIV